MKNLPETCANLILNNESTNINIMIVFINNVYLDLVNNIFYQNILLLLYIINYRKRECT